MSDHPTQALDRAQLKCLLATSLKLDWRGAVHPFSSAPRKKSHFPPFIIVIAMNLMYSLIIGVIMAMHPDVFTGLVIGATVAMVMVGLQVLLDYGNILAAPDDQAVIAPHPVNAKTYFCAKVIHVLIYVAILSLSLSSFPALLTAFIRRTVLLVPAVPVLCLISNIFITCVIINLYVLATKFGNRRRIERVLGYLQVAFATIFYGTFITINQIQQIRPVLNQLQGSWLAYLPPYWFAGWFRLAFSGWDLTTFLTGVGGIVAFAGILWLGASRLSSSYGMQTTGTASVQAQAAGRARFAWLQRMWRAISNPEERAVLTLVRTQFKHDVRFRMSILAVIPMAFLMLFMYGREEMSFVDPFISASPELGSGYIGVFMILAWLPIAFQISTLYSSSYRASWVFFDSQVDRVRLVLATKKIVMVLFTVPLCLSVGLYFGYRYGHLPHGLLFGAFLFCLTLMTLTVANMIVSGAPFAKETPRAQTSMAFGLLFVVVGVIYMIPGLYFTKNGFGSYAAYLLILATIVLINFLLTRMQNKRIRGLVNRWEHLAS